MSFLGRDLKTFPPYQNLSHTLIKRKVNCTTLVPPIHSLSHMMKEHEIEPINDKELTERPQEKRFICNSFFLLVF